MDKTGGVPPLRWRVNGFSTWRQVRHPGCQVQHPGATPRFRTPGSAPRHPGTHVQQSHSFLEKNIGSRRRVRHPDRTQVQHPGTQHPGSAPRCPGTQVQHPGSAPSSSRFSTHGSGFAGWFGTRPGSAPVPWFGTWPQILAPRARRWQGRLGVSGVT